MSNRGIVMGLYLQRDNFLETKRCDTTLGKDCTQSLWGWRITPQGKQGRGKAKVFMLLPSDRTQHTYTTSQ